MMSEFKPTQDLHGMNAKYIYQNALQSSVFSHFADIDGNWNGLSVADVFGDKEIKVGYVNGWLSTSQNMAKIFIVLSLVIILLIAPVFSGEYGGVDNIILTSKYGKTKCATAKVLASLLSAVFITTLVVIFNLLIAVAIYGTEGLDCSILFAPIDFLEGYIPFNITCGTVLKYQILLAFMSAISVTGIVLILSAVCKSQMIAFVISAAIHVIPIMLPISETSALYRIIVLMPLFYSQYISIMSVEQMHNGILDMVDDGKIAFTIAVELSYLSENEQYELHAVMDLEQCTPSLSQANRMKRISQSGKLDMDAIYSILEEEKPNQREQIKICASTLEEYFPDDFTPKQKVELIERLVKEWHEKQIKDNGRNR